MLRLLLLLLSLSIVSENAHALVKVRAYGGLNQTDPKSAGMEYGQKSATIYGAALELPLMPFIGLELGAFQSKRSYIQNTLLAETTTTLQFRNFPVLLRANLGGFLSLGFGAYYGVYTGTASEETKSKLTNLSSTQSRNYKDINIDGSDYGLASALGLYLPIVPMLKLVIEGRYLMGFKNNDTRAGASTKFNDTQGMLGVQIGF